jgi:lipoic acid synthetase
MRLRALTREWNLHTVCEEAHCPNIGECWEDATATFMILGDVCTRNCGYCAVTHGKPIWEDREEPQRIGRAVRDLGLEYVVITSVNRDDLADGGAAHWAATIRAVREHAPACRVEVLVPDFQGQEASIDAVTAARPDVFNHNTETVPRLYKVARHGGRYERTLALFRHARAVAPELTTKSGVILGLGESRDELVGTMRDLRAVDVQILTLGQYLRPSAQHLPVAKYYHPDEFAELAAAGRALGFTHVESGPLVRSSYHAKNQTDAATATRSTTRKREPDGMATRATSSKPDEMTRGAASSQPAESTCRATSSELAESTCRATSSELAESRCEATSSELAGSTCEATSSELAESRCGATSHLLDAHPRRDPHANLR